jgi:hypothetical protein
MRSFVHQSSQKNALAPVLGLIATYYTLFHFNMQEKVCKKAKKYKS